MWDIKYCHVNLLCLDACNILLINFPYYQLFPAVYFLHQRQTDHFTLQHLKQTVCSSYRICQWLSIALIIKSKLLALVHKALHAPPLLYAQIIFSFLRQANQALASSSGLLYTFASVSVLFLYSFHSSMLLIFTSQLKFHLKKAFPDNL